MIPLTGNTFPHKDAIRAAGGRWDAATKTWSVPDDRHAELQTLVGAAGHPQRVAGETRLVMESCDVYDGMLFRGQGGVALAVTRVSKSFYVPDEDTSAYGLSPGQGYRMVNVYAVPATVEQEAALISREAAHG